jgi:hypothetical protein
MRVQDKVPAALVQRKHHSCRTTREDSARSMSHASRLGLVNAFPAADHGCDIHACAGHLLTYQSRNALVRIHD